MKGDNTETVKKLYEAFKSGDGKTISQIFHPNIEWTQMKGFPNGGHFVGVNDVFEKVFGLFPMYWNNWGAEAQEYLADQDKVVVIGYYHGVSIETGRELKAPMVHIYTLKNNLITHFQQYTDTYLVQKALTNG